jgi:hypothetical protein
MIGSLMYAAISTRPNISFVVQVLSQFLTNLATEHVTTTKHVLQYLKGMADLSIIYRCLSTALTVLGYSDADWGSNLIDCRSTSGYVFLLADSTISWSSKQQTSVTLLSMEAKYMAIRHAT